MRSKLVPVPPDKDDLYLASHIVLKPCPFCGKYPVVMGDQNVETKNFVYRVSCTNFHCHGSTLCCQATKELARDGAIKSWQQRFDTPKVG